MNELSWCRSFSRWGYSRLQRGFSGQVEDDLFAESRPDQFLSESGKAGGILGVLAKDGIQLPACTQPCQHLRSGPEAVRTTLVNLETWLPFGTLP